MKRTWLSIISTLILVFVMSCAFSYFIMPFFKAQMGRRTYSETNCLTEQITDDMQLHDIAKLYRDGNAAVAIQIVGVYANGTYGLPEHGSGVCIASNGYKTALTKEDGSFLQASRGSYIVTNYHVIRLSENTLYDGYELNLITESEEVFPCSILWSKKNLDIAKLYCD